MGGFYERENQFYGVVPGRLTTLQWMASDPSVKWNHKFKKQKGYKLEKGKWGKVM